jgi:hypothetical protein
VPDNTEATPENELTNATQERQLKNLQSCCSEKLICDIWYEQLRVERNDYCPNFAAVTELSLDDVGATGTVIIPDIGGFMPE